MSQSPDLDPAGEFVIHLAIARVGDMPFPWQPRKVFEMWLKDFDRAMREIVADDIITNTGDA